MIDPDAHPCPWTQRIRLVATTALLFGLVACAAQTDDQLRPPTPVLPGPVVMLAQVRAAGAAAPGSLEVQPLRDPGVADLRLRAEQLEAHGDVDGATSAIAQALAIQPGDPELLQQAAEYALYHHDWAKAAAWAKQSFDSGPKTGSLCRRNWVTLRFVAMAHADVAAMQAATAALTACTLEPPPRY